MMPVVKERKERIAPINKVESNSRDNEGGVRAVRVTGREPRAMRTLRTTFRARE